VYTYTLNPLIVGEEPAATQQQLPHSGQALPQASAVGQGQQQQPAVDAALAGAHPPGSVSGWELRLVMEFCDQVRYVLREQLTAWLQQYA
jgi:hypothetical protein